MSEPNYRYLECVSHNHILVFRILPQGLDGANSKSRDLLRQELLAAVALNGTRKVAVDLSAVGSLGSDGLRPLLSLRKKLQERGGEMLLCGLCEGVREVLLSSRLINASGTTAAPFGVAENSAAAVARLSPSAGRG